LARPPREGRISLNRVGLRYGKDCEPALMNINLNIPAGKMIALTGPNGAGKSSVLRLVQGLYQPQSGAVTIDGVDIRQLSPKLLRRAIACAPQKIDLFYGTIAQNLRLADGLATGDALRAAADEAGILDAILALPQQFDTRIGDSTTQSLPPGFLRQLTIARALVRKAPILLIDEPEAMLDEEGATVIQKMLERVRGKRTVVLISHRPSYIRLADFAVFIRGGNVEFGGTPDGAIAKLLGQAKHGKAA
jgi:ATP-binding cassette subfamily C protein/ATP-binding cassette subfamily C protein LapB